MDKKKLEKLTYEMLVEIGEDADREGLKDTPKRIPVVYGELFSGMGKKPEDIIKKVFTVEKNNIVIEKNIDFYSMCEHDLLPFFGQIHVAYIPDGKVLGFGDIIKITELYSRRLQIQERLTNEICDAVFELTKCQGVMIIIKARHLCIEMKGSRKTNSEIVTSSVKGIFEKDELKKNEILTLLKI
jgi:GTP cyclohydrolase I